MKKVININFQGRVIPIEETAYDILKQYVESLRRYFSNEDGRDEIINDIESRIAELFSERLKKGATCITDEDVLAVIAGMGRPEDFDAENADANTAGSHSQQYTNSSQQSSSSAGMGSAHSNEGPGRGRLYRNADDQIIAGVCSGLANFFHIDPVILRVVFVLLLFSGPGFLVYIILWIVVPSQSIQSSITKRLYRSADDRIVAGVCGGLAAYFNVNIWIPRLIFLLPLIILLLSGTFNSHWVWDFWLGTKIITGSMGSTLFITYLILWIAVPVAVTAAEKLEMRGERVDLNSIRNRVKEDMESLKSKAQNWEKEVKQTAQDFSEKAKQFSQSEQFKTFTTEASVNARNASQGMAHIIGVLFKAFFLLIVGMIAMALFIALVVLLFGGIPVMSFKDFLLEGFWQNLLAWLVIILFLGVPIVSLITWVIPRIRGVRSKNRYLGYVFGTLWIIGIVSVILLVGSVIRNFKRGAVLKENVSITQPSSGKLYIDVSNDNVHYRHYNYDWLDIKWEGNWSFYDINEDTARLNTVRVRVAKSNDSMFHVVQVKSSRGNSSANAQSLVQKINFNIIQRDSMLILPDGFSISQNEKFRNQCIMIIVEVPVGKRIFLNRSISEYNWLDFRYNRLDEFGIYDKWDRIYSLETDTEYIMTPNGPKKTEESDKKTLRGDEYNEPDISNT